MPGKPFSKLDKESFVFKHAGLLLTINSLLLTFIIILIYMVSKPVEIKPLWVLLFLAFTIFSIIKTFVPVCPECNAPLDVDILILNLFEPTECWRCGGGFHEGKNNT